MEYEAPKVEVIELDETDMIQTSSEIGGGSSSENELPPVVMSLDRNTQ